ncbi:Hint domain-containing protein [Shimia biformata]|uniref:Hint domain-containing protein n=1 Tax=Shimia biformata TaxID=1294299 RepID=UPI00194F5EC1|nr:Hint domain-containing protein [Shimia biformata]
MAEVSFFARGDSSTANNAVLNAQNTNTTPTTEITFSSGTDGDLKLEPNGGLPDPDTTVIVDGVEMTFTVEFSGFLPSSNKLKNVNGEDLRGEPIVVITLENGQRLFFLPDGVSEATLNSFPNGAHDLTGYTEVAIIPVCFVAGSLIATPAGDVPVETLRPGDLVNRMDGGPVPIRFVAERKLGFTELLRTPKFRPVCVARDTFGPGAPYRDLWLSPQHRIMFSGWEADLLFQSEDVLFPATCLGNLRGSRRASIPEGVRYFHLMFDRHEVIFANGLACESLYPGDTAVASLTDVAREQLAASFPDMADDWRDYGPLARTGLTRREGDMLLAYLGLGQGRNPARCRIGKPIAA